MRETPKRRVVSLSLPTLPTDRLWRRMRQRDAASHASEWPAETRTARPLATVETGAKGLTLAAVNAATRAVGLSPGLPLADARALLPALVTGDADPAGDDRARAGLAEWATRYTPWTAVEETGGLWLDITGSAHLFGGEEALLDDLTARSASFHLSVRAAVADTPGAAWAAARYGEGLSERSWLVVPPGATRELMSPLPVAALRIPSDDAEALRRLGLRRIGDLYGLARAPLAGRFGTGLLDALDRLLGRLAEPVSPIRPAPSRRVRLNFPEPIGTAEDVAAALERLLAALTERLARAGEGARRLHLTGYRTDGTLADAAIGTGRAERDPAHLFRLFREKLARFDPGFGFETMILAATTTAPMAPAQNDLDGAGARGDDLARLLDRIGNRLGAGRVGALACPARHPPEKASAYGPLRPWRSVPASRTRRTDGPPQDEAVLNAPHPEERADASVSKDESHSPTQPRPLHLLVQPEAVEAIAPVPDGPPVLFRWRRRTHKVVRAEGPERIAPEWWLEDPALLASGQDRIRDYYRVEDEAGGRYWLFRAGMYRADAPPVWYLHGVFP